LDELLWRLKDIREDLMSTGVGGRCYNCDEWSTPVVNLAAAIKLIESNAELSRLSALTLCYICFMEKI
jgi:hypothetical protein